MLRFASMGGWPLWLARVIRLAGPPPLLWLRPAPMSPSPACRAGPQEVMRVNSVANEVWSLGRGNVAITLDATSPTSVDAAIGRVLSELGRLDILVNAADLVAAAPLEALSPADWDAILGANLLGPALVARAAAAPMKQAGYGRIINLVSVLAARGVANTTAYAAAHWRSALAQPFALAGVGPQRDHGQRRPGRHLRGSARLWRG